MSSYLSSFEWFLHFFIGEVWLGELFLKFLVNLKAVGLVSKRVPLLISYLFMLFVGCIYLMGFFRIFGVLAAFNSVESHEVNFV